MQRYPEGKYRPYLHRFPVRLADRRWPERQITEAPRWCSVDLRDGNQALVNPMSLEQKLEMFHLLISIGFKEIEIGFPAASGVEFDFARTLIERGMIPAEAVPQVLVQSRAHLIDRTFEAIDGASQAIVHLYNSTSELQRRVVFEKSKAEITDIALSGLERIKKLSKETSTKIIFEYSPESFTGTELDFAVEICNAVIAAWGPSVEEKMIINLPATVEMSTPNVYADQIEWFCRNVDRREQIIISVHTHNDRGTGVAASELALLAGADRVEGTLFGNGERTGNVDIVTLALNLFTQGVDPKLDFSAISRIREVYERCTGMEVHSRHPYAGDLVFTAFSGSHQDAINKGMRARARSRTTLWEVPYLPIDPSDVGRKYDAIIRINSQSGKGGVAYIMQSEFGCDLPKDMHPEFGALIQQVSEELGTEVPASDVWAAFAKEYLERSSPYRFLSFRSGTSSDNPDLVSCELSVEHGGEKVILKGEGNGPVNAGHQALLSSGREPFKIRNFFEHARSSGSDAEAVAYIQVESSRGTKRFGVGIHPNTTIASIKALVSAVNRLGG